MNCFSDRKTFANSWPSASNFKSFSRSLEQFLLTEGQFWKQNTNINFFQFFFQVDNESQLQALDDYYYYEEDNSRYSNRKGPIYDYYDYDMDDRIHDIRKNNAIFRYVILRNNFFHIYK